MMRLAATMAFLVAAACAPTVVAPTAPGAVGPLPLHADRAVPADIDAAFRAAVAGRYAGDIGQDAAVADLEANSFVCVDNGAYPQVRAGGVLTVCELPKPHGLCADKWTVSLRLKPVTRQVSYHRVGAEGAFARTCVAGASPEG